MGARALTSEEKTARAAARAQAKADAQAKAGDSDEARLERLLDEQTKLIDEPIDDSMLQRQKLADIRSRVYSLRARLAKRPAEQVAYERIANECATEARQAAKASNVDRILALLGARDQELELAAAFGALARKRR